MSAPLPVRPLVPWLVLTSAQNLISDLLRLWGELRVNFAGVEEHGGVGLLDQCIEVVWDTQPRWVREDTGLDNVGEGVVPNKWG